MGVQSSHRAVRGILKARSTREDRKQRMCPRVTLKQRLPLGRSPRDSGFVGLAVGAGRRDF